MGNEAVYPASHVYMIPYATIIKVTCRPQVLQEIVPFRRPCRSEPIPRHKREIPESDSESRVVVPPPVLDPIGDVMGCSAKFLEQRKGIEEKRPKLQV
jgi:hypothetical protein